MQLDLPTLAIVTVFVTALAGGLLIFSWCQNRGVRALGWWGLSLLVSAAASVLLLGRGTIPDALSIGAANVLLYAAYGLLWIGFRRFETRPAPLSVALAGAALWLAACGIPDFYRSFDARVALSSLIVAAYTLAAAAEIWRGRRERLMSRVPILVLLLLHAVLMLFRYPALQAWGHPGETTMFTFPWVSLHAFEALLFTVVIAFLLLCMTKERGELEQRLMASLDPLTGVLNRRAFLTRGRDLLDGDRRAGRPSALLLVDLDHFKRVNDRFGHAVGDEVLRRFCRATEQVSPPGALLARLGGEEFGLLLPGAGPEAASDIAQRLRASFARARLEADGIKFQVTVSVGLATSEEAGHVLEGLLAAADLTLYQAKELGRDRVERHLIAPPFALAA